LGLAGAIGAQAQVYSVNAVGYINVTVPKAVSTNPAAPVPGFAIVANQLNTGGNTVAEVIPTAKNLTTIYVFANNQYSSASYFDGVGWIPGDLKIAPGTAFFFANYDAADQTVTFVGEVPQGALTTPLKTGFNLVASQVPQAGALVATLGYAPGQFDVVYKFNTTTQSYDSYSYLGVVTPPIWSPMEPSLAVGEGAFIQTDADRNWTRNFSVN
jgi:hypothetical protein